MNALDPRVVTGTIGELLVQIRLFQYGVQAAPPLKDSGTDLIAVRGRAVLAVQVKTTASEENTWPKGDLDRECYVLALVRLRGTGAQYDLDRCDVYLYRKAECDGWGWPEIEQHRICADLVQKLFEDIPVAPVS